MNKKLSYLLVALLGLGVVSCSSDDSGDVLNEGDLEGNPVGSEVIINELSYQGDDWIEIYNPTNETVDISTLWFCLGPGRYEQIVNLDILEGSTTNLEGESFVVLSGYSLPDNSGGLGLYLNDNAFGNADNILDFVQYGASGSIRENVAVEAGLWTAGEFVPVISSETNTIVYDGDVRGQGVSFWSETTEPTPGAVNIFSEPVLESEVRSTVVLNEVSYGENDWVEIYNPTNDAVDISNYWLCLRPTDYDQISNLTGESTVIESGEFVVINIGAGNIENLSDSEGLGLFSDIDGDFGNFGSGDFLVDFVQYGESGSIRENVAADAGLWTEGQFVSVTSSNSNTIVYSGSGIGVESWSETTEPTVGRSNVFVIP